MTSLTIGIIGAQGRFGSSLYKRLVTCMPHTHLLASTDKTQAQGIAAAADIIMIVVRPSQVEALLHEIAPCLRPGARVVSFVAGTDPSAMQKVLGRAAAHAMADPEWHAGAYLISNEATSKEFSWLAGLTTQPMSKLPSAEALHDYTMLMCQAHAAVLLAAAGRIKNAQAHLSFVAERLAVLGIVGPHLRSSVTGDPLEKLRALATPGGITEKFVAALATAADPQTVYRAVDSQTRR